MDNLRYFKVEIGEAPCSTSKHLSTSSLVLAVVINFATAQNASLAIFLLHFCTVPLTLRLVDMT